MIAPDYVLTAAHCYYPAKSTDIGKAYFGSHTTCMGGAGGHDGSVMDCPCKDSWDYNGKTFSGCALTAADDAPWCYAKDPTCAGATQSKVDSSLAWG